MITSENIFVLQNPQADTKRLEDHIDIMVYKLYNLTYEEIEVIDPEIEKIISKEEYLSGDLSTEVLTKVEAIGEDG